MTRMQLTCVGASHHFCSNLAAQLFSDHHKSPKLNRPHHFGGTKCCFSQKHLVFVHGSITRSPQTPPIIHNLSSLSESGWGTAQSRSSAVQGGVESGRQGPPPQFFFTQDLFEATSPIFSLQNPARNLDNSNCNQCHAHALIASLRAEFKSVCRIPRVQKALNAENKFNLTWKTKGLNIYAPNMSSSLFSTIYSWITFVHWKSSLWIGHSLFRKHN